MPRTTIAWEDFIALDPENRVEDHYHLKGRLYHCVAAQQFTRPLLDELCELTTMIRKIAKGAEGSAWLRGLLADKRSMLYFIQPSTRTFLSFKNACHILGVCPSEVRDPSTSSEVKGETFSDTIRTFSSYVDFIVMRTPLERGSDMAIWTLNRSERPVPVINAGSGKDQHPTQALLDIYTLQRSLDGIGGIDGKTIAFVGDLGRGRTVRSLSYLMRNYRDVTLYFVAPEPFQVKQDIKEGLDAHGVKYIETDDLSPVISKVDAVYMTRIQDEYDVAGESRGVSYEKCHFKPEFLARLKKTAIIMHPLPRRAELPVAIDEDPRAMYWRQERNGMWMRAAIIVKIFEKDNLVRDKAARLGISVR